MYHLTKISGKFDELSKQALDNLPDADYIIQKKTNKRSTNQNRSYWLLRVQPITDWLKEQGNEVSEDDVHYWLKVKFLGYKFININTKEVKVLKSTKELSTLDFMAYMNEIAIHFAPLGLLLKDPNQTEFLDNEKTT